MSGSPRDVGHGQPDSAFAEDDLEFGDDKSQDTEDATDDDAHDDHDVQVDVDALATEQDDETDAHDEDADEDEDALRDGEFVCRSCHMAKRESALADEDAMLCRDCV